MGVSEGKLPQVTNKKQTAFTFSFLLLKVTTKQTNKGCVWLNIKYFLSVKYFRERKIFSSIWLHYENCSRKCFHVFGCILKMLFSY